MHAKMTRFALMTLAAVLLHGQVTHAAILFSDNFNTQADGAIDSFNPPTDTSAGKNDPGRQGGSLSPLNWISPQGSDKPQIISDVLRFGAPNARRTYMNYDWGTNGAITSAGGFVVEFDFLPRADPVNDKWLAFGLGLRKDELDHSTPQYVNNASTDYAVLLRRNGGYQAFDNATKKADGDATPFTPQPVTANKIKLQFVMPSWALGSNVVVTGWVDGNQIDLDSGVAGVSSYTFQWADTTSSAQRYFFFEANEYGERIDNLTISTIPEPASLALLAVGGALMVLRRRRMGNKRRCAMDEMTGKHHTGGLDMARISMTLGLKELSMTRGTSTGRWLLAAGVMLALAPLAHAATITQTRQDTGRNWDNAWLWGDTAVVAENDYVTPSNRTLRAIGSSTTTTTFPGGSLTMLGSLQFKSPNSTNGAYDIADLRMDGGIIQNPTDGNNVVTVGGAMSVLSDSRIEFTASSTQSRSYDFATLISGSRQLTLQGSTYGVATISNAGNTYTGLWNLTVGTLQFANAGAVGSGADIKVAGGTLQILGNWDTSGQPATALERADLQVVSGTVALGDYAWTLNTLTLGSNELLPGTYSISQLNSYSVGSFTGSTGTITVIPEPALLAMAAAGAMLVLCRRQRTM